MSGSATIRWRWFWVAQAFSIGRVLATFLFVVAVPFIEYSKLAAAIYALAVITDIVDGRIARYGKVSSTFGSVMDLFGDRYLTIISCMYAGFRGVNFVPLAIIILRELFSAVMQIIQIDGQVVLGVNSAVGKIVLGTIWGATFFLILNPDTNQSLYRAPYYLVAIFYVFYLPYRIYKGIPNIRDYIISDLIRGRS
jgi:CDP-diacylglycerol--glycerol-3-phosphate 3-phosphatidyltransferase